MNTFNSPNINPASIHVTFHFGSHELRDDATSFQSLLELTDMYVPEARGWTSNAKSRFMNVSTGIETPEQANQMCIDNGEGGREAFTMQLWKMLYGTYKHIELLDVPSGFEPEDEGAKDVYETLDTKTKSFSEFLHELNIETDSEVARQDKRENYISEKLKELLEGLARSDADNNQLRILLSIGAVHTRLYEKFVSDPALKHVVIKQEFSEVPQPYYYRADLTKRKLYGEEISEEFLAKLFLEDIFMSHVEAMTLFTDANDKIKLLRAIIEPFSFEDTKEIFETWNYERVGRYVAIEIMKTEGYQES